MKRGQDLVMGNSDGQLRCHQLGSSEHRDREMRGCLHFNLLVKDSECTGEGLCSPLDSSVESKRNGA